MNYSSHGKEDEHYIFVFSPGQTKDLEMTHFILLNITTFTLREIQCKTCTELIRRHNDETARVENRGSVGWKSTLSYITLLLQRLLRCAATSSPPTSLVAMGHASPPTSLT